MQLSFLISLARNLMTPFRKNDFKFYRLLIVRVRTGEIIDVSMRDVDGWSKIKKVENGEEGYIPTTYFKLVDGYC